MRVENFYSTSLDSRAMTDSTRDIGWLLSQDHPHHDGCGCGQGVPDDVMRKTIWTWIGADVPRKDVLCMIVTQIDLWYSPYGYAFGFLVVGDEQIGF